jgi:hypothetical protein
MEFIASLPLIVLVLGCVGIMGWLLGELSRVLLGNRARALLLAIGSTALGYGIQRMLGAAPDPGSFPWVLYVYLSPPFLAGWGWPMLLHGKDRDVIGAYCEWRPPVDGGRDACR